MSNQQKLLEGLGGEGVILNVRSLAKFMASNAVLVRSRVGRMRGNIPLPEALYAFKPSKLTSTASLFYSERVSQGHLNFIPREDEASLTALEKRLRRAVESKTLADDFMPTVAYEALRRDFERIRADYFEKRDEILSNWGTLQSNFETGARELLENIRMPKQIRAKLLADFLSQVPSAERYGESFSMSLTVHAFPAESGSLEGLNQSLAADMSETWKDEVVATALLSIENRVGAGWVKLLSAMKQYMSTDKIKSNTIDSLIRFCDELSWKNLFRNRLLDELCAAGKELAKGTSDEQAQVVEDCIVAIFGYAKESKIDLDFKGSPYTVNELEDLLSIHEHRSKKGA